MQKYLKPLPKDFAIDRQEWLESLDLIYQEFGEQGAMFTAEV